MNSNINQPLISIITIVKNGEKHLEQTIKSVLNQSYTNFEYIVIDGGSTDRTIEIIKKFQNQITYWESSQDKGIANAFNKGIAKAKGEIIGMINSDDWYSEEAFSEIIKNFDDKFSIYFGNVDLFNENKLLKVRKSKIRLLSLGMYIMHPSVFIKRTVYEEIGVFDESLRIAMDFDLMLRIKLAKKYQFKYIDKSIANMRLNGASANIIQMHKEEIFVFKKNLKGLILYIAIGINYLNRFKAKLRF